MKKWQEQLDKLNVPYEIINDEIFLYNDDMPTTEHQVYKLIRSMKNNKYKKFVKQFSHRINRRRTSHKIQNDNYDDIPVGQQVYEENPWNWD